MSQDQNHPLYSKPKNQHPLSDRPPENETNQQPRGRSIPIPMASKFPLVTYVLIAINVFIFVLRYLAPELGEMVLLAGYGSAELILAQRQFYRLFTMMFLHANEAHILFNMIALYYIGTNMERLFGSGRFLLIYLLGGLAGSVMPMFFSNNGVLGASGAVFAIWGAEAIFMYQHLNIFGQAGRTRLKSSLTMMLFNFVLGFSINAIGTVAGAGIGISNSAHFGGLVGGALLTYFIGPRFIPRRKQESVTEGEIPIEIVQTRSLQDVAPYILYSACGLLALLLFALFIRT